MILVIVLIVSALPILLTMPRRLPAVLFVLALLIITAAANSAAKKQNDSNLWMDAEWHCCEEKKDNSNF